MRTGQIQNDIQKYHTLRDSSGKSYVEHDVMHANKREIGKIYFYTFLNAKDCRDFVEKYW